MNEQKMPDFGGPGGPGGPMGGPPKAGYTEKTYETDWILTESTQYPSGIVLKEGSLPAASEGKALLMTVDGVPTTIAPGTYPGKVVFTVYTLTNIPAAYTRRADAANRIGGRCGELYRSAGTADAGRYDHEDRRSERHHCGRRNTEGALCHCRQHFPLLQRRQQ